MLITLVKESVMRCFCHSCQAPSLPAVGKRNAPFKKSNTKVRAKQPRTGSKKVKFITTEIRCQEKSKGGLSYEVILAEPAPNVALPKKPLSPNKNVSAEEIEQKLKAAEERRLSLEAKKMAELSNKLAKIEEASRKKDELNNEFIIQTKEALESKMEQHVEKREEIISSMKEKLKIHSQDIEKTRNSLEQQKEIEKAAIEEKLKIAQSLRDDNLKKMIERLKEHERRAEIVRQNKAALCKNSTEHTANDSLITVCG
ncbi:stathmin isoform X2 [Condylostylus longicornis]|uniref:stathmin isoform X2 n=1 Tax=Condylostylus longicornis TaxID=2530218 RepID=UPI00244E0B83|nr:stathmin isoform X2 [Condylostylus longicornis]